MKNKDTLQTDSSRYSAFISYPREDLRDRLVAEHLQNLLVKYNTTKKIQSMGYPKKLGSIFRDETHMVPGSVPNWLSRGLEKSSYLILICSKHTRKSEWVEKEVTAFIRLHGVHNIIPVLLELTPKETYPKCLLKAIEEPGFGSLVQNDFPRIEFQDLDLRSSDTKRWQKVLNIRFVDIVARMLSIDLSLLRDSRSKEIITQRKIRLWIISSTIFSTIFICLIVAGIVGRQQYINTISEQSIPSVAAIVPFLFNIETRITSSENVEVPIGIEDWSTSWGIIDYEQTLADLYGSQEVTAKELLSFESRAVRQYTWWDDIELQGNFNLAIRNSYSADQTTIYSFNLEQPAIEIRPSFLYSLTQNRKVQSITLGSIYPFFESQNQANSYPSVSVTFRTDFSKFKINCLEQRSPWNNYGQLVYDKSVVDQYLDMSNIFSLRSNPNEPEQYVVPVGSTLQLHPQIVTFKTKFDSFEVTNIRQALKVLNKPNEDAIYLEDYNELSNKATEFIRSSWKPTFFEYLKTLLSNPEKEIANMGLTPWYQVVEYSVNYEDVLHHIGSVQVNGKTLNMTEMRVHNEDSLYSVNWSVFALSLLNNPKPQLNDSYSFDLENPLLGTITIDEPGCYYASSSLFSQNFGVEAGELSWQIIAIPRDMFDSIINDRMLSAKQINGENKFDITDQNVGNLANYIRDWKIEVTVDGRIFTIPGVGDISLDLENAGIFPPGDKTVCIDLIYSNFETRTWIKKRVFEGTINFN